MLRGIPSGVCFPKPLWRPSLNGYTPVRRAVLEGVQTGRLYALSRMIPSWASFPRWGVEPLGLFQETSLMPDNILARYCGLSLLHFLPTNIICEDDQDIWLIGTVVVLDQ